MTRLALAVTLLQGVAGDYDEARAVEYAKLAGAAYCPQESLESWSCGAKCSADVSSVTVCNGFHVKAFVGKWEDKCLVSFEGTSDVTSFIKDLEFVKSAIDWDGCSGCKVHGGFLDEYQSVRQCVKTALLGTDCPVGSQIRTTGHSLGAAMNSIAMIDLSNEGWVIEESYDFGKPRTGNSAFAAAHNQLLAGKVWRVTHAMDPVPQVPPDALIVDWKFEHVEPEIYYQGKVSAGYEECTEAHDHKHCAGQHWNLPLDLLFIADHLDYMGVNTNTFGCKSSTALV